MKFNPFTPSTTEKIKGILGSILAVSFFLIFPIFLIFFGISENLTKELHPENVKILYKSGSVFAEGSNRVYNKYYFISQHKNRVGIWKFYYPGNALETQMEYDKEGKLVNQKEYAEDGKLTMSSTLSDEQSTESDYENGQLVFESVSKQVEDGSPDDTYKETTNKKYFSTGRLKEEWIEIDGNLDGINKEWYETGILKSEANYANDKRNGPYKEWDKDGNLILEVNYENGLIVNS